MWGIEIDTCMDIWHGHLHVKCRK